MFCALGLLGGLVLGFVGGLVFGAGWPEGWGGGGGGLPLAVVNTLEVFLGSLRGGREEAAGHLVERGVAWVFHPDNPRFPPVDTGGSAHLHGRGVRLWTLVPTRGSSAPSPPL